jgi:hypothetical protein
MERLAHRASPASQHSKKPEQGCVAHYYVSQVSCGYFLVLQAVNEAPRPIGGNYPTSDSNLNQYFDSKVGLVDSASSTHGRHITGNPDDVAAAQDCWLVCQAVTVCACGLAAADCAFACILPFTGMPLFVSTGRLSC